jgi:hypothetical protein
MHFIECKIVTAVLEPVYDPKNLGRVCDSSVTPVIGWKIQDDIVTPVTCMGVVEGLYIVKHGDCSDCFVPQKNEVFRYQDRYDSEGQEISGVPTYSEQMNKKFQEMHDARNMPNI